MRNQVARFHAGLVGGRVIHGGDNLDETLFLRHLYAQPSERAARLGAHIVEILGRKITGMRVKRGQHTVDCGGDQVGRVHVFHVFIANTFKDIAEQVQLFIHIRRLLAFLRQQRTGHIHRDQHAAENAAKACQSKFCHHLAFRSSHARSRTAKNFALGSSASQCEPCRRVNGLSLLTHLKIECLTVTASL